MNILQKTLLIILCSIFLGIAHGEDKNFPYIDDISYEGNLNNETLIEINGENFNNCNNFKISGRTMKIDTIEEEKITYYYGENKYISGNVNFECNGIITSSNFFFPYLNGYESTYIKNEGEILLKGDNLEDASSVKFEDGERLKINEKADKSILGILPKGLTSTEFYVESNGYKSNLYNLYLKLPIIDFIYAPDGFYESKYIYIHGKNLNYYKNAIIMFGDEEIKSFETTDNGKLYFKIPKDSIGEYDISVISNGMQTDDLEINIIPSTPYIKSVHLEGKYESNNGEKEYIEGLKIIGENLNNEDIDVYINGKSYTIDNQEYDELFIDDYVPEKGNNFIILSNDGIKSNIVNLEDNASMPYITSIEQDYVEDNYSYFNIGISNFDSDNYKLYYNESKNITIDSCTSYKCKVKLNTSDLKGNISVGIGNGYKTIGKDYDMLLENIAIINDIKFDGEEIKKGVKFTINGENLTNSELTLTNFASEKFKGQYDIESGSKTIKGNLSNDFESDKNSTIKIVKNGITSTITFQADEIEDNKINGIGYIHDLEISDESSVVKPGTKIKIIGKGFHNSDKIKIGNEIVPIIYSHNNLAYFLVPEYIEEGEYVVKLENNIGLYSNSVDFFINDINDNGEIKFISNVDSVNKFNINEEYKNEKVYSLLLSNRGNDIMITDFDFKISSEDLLKDLGTFLLKIDGETVGESIISNEGYLKFENIKIFKQYDDYEVSILKSSPFINEGSYNIELENYEIFKYGTNNKIKNINTDYLRNHDFNVYNNYLTKCYDTDNGNSNCNGYTSGVSTTTNNISTSNKTSTVKITDTKPNNISTTKKITKISSEEKIYLKIDELTAKIITKKEKLELKDQLNFYKDFRLKLKNLLAKYNNSKYYKYYEYYYDIFDREYKSVFKEYILSK